MMRNFFNPTNLCWLDNLNNVYQVIYLYNNTTPYLWLTQHSFVLATINKNFVVILSVYINIFLNLFTLGDRYG